MSRYDLFRSRNMCTHITSNLNSGEIQEIYGHRMREMFNLLAFSPETAGKR
ncbi:hypothetical protein GA0116948_10140 [Chitinophaga costaii]|uniref:Uncharacterized protein n=1 Tax=Chitinophaga costaii TaxID=1335309 RepID=A0A1C3YQ65_9BACT|nr:hypothetical protein [Chitinophaga costaii]SCB72229.1 hypothetical protein GA0116948_10140 [Chitinophaga costaii]